MKIKIKTLKTFKLKGKTRVKIEFDAYIDEYEDHEFITRKVKWNEWMLKHLVSFCPWDFSYNLQLFGDSLIKTGKNSIVNGNLLHSTKYGRRAMYAGTMLNKIAVDEQVPEHLKACYRFEENKEIHWEDIPDSDYIEMKTKYLTQNKMGMEQRDYDSKMVRLQVKKERDIEKRVSKDIFAFIHKYQYQFWD